MKDAWLTGGMFRGFENILLGRDPMDAPQIVQRICGVCPVSHALASCMALEDAAKLTPPREGRLLRNLMQGANFLQSHILSFYQLSSQDFFQGPDAAPFAPRQKHPDLRLGEAATRMMLDQYLESLDIRALCHEMSAIFGGRMPHVHGIVPGGTSAPSTAGQIQEFRSRLKTVREFVETRYVPLLYLLSQRYDDLAHTGKGWATAMCMGVFPHPDTGEYAIRPGVWAGGREYPFEPDKVMENVRYSLVHGVVGRQSVQRAAARRGSEQGRSLQLFQGRALQRHAHGSGPARAHVGGEHGTLPHGTGTCAETPRSAGTHVPGAREDFVFSIMGRHLAQGRGNMVCGQSHGRLARRP